MKTLIFILIIIASFIQCQNSYPPIPDGEKEIQQIKKELEQAKKEACIKIDTIKKMTKELDSISKEPIKKKHKVYPNVDSVAVSQGWIKSIFIKKHK